MSQLQRPLPALYVVYVLRSTVRRASLYIGSTPNPPRRLKQHNGEAKGGARRTARDRLRPWEMIALVSGFPSSIAALKFEWALTNPHLSLHIPDESRLALSSSRKRNGMPRRPPTSLRFIMSNLHLLTAVPSFRRWPLNLHFFAKDAFAAWQNGEKTAEFSRHLNLNIVQDYGPEEEVHQSHGEAWGIHALPLDYKPIRDYVEKANNAVKFEQEGHCVHCKKELEPGKGLYPMCPNDDCQAMGHLGCWSYDALAKGDDEVIPDNCTCPSCGVEFRWGDIIKELSLRTRGEKEVDKLLKKRKAKASS